MGVDLPLPLLGSAPGALALDGGGAGGRGERTSTNQPPSSGFDACETSEAAEVCEVAAGGEWEKAQPVEVGSRPEGGASRACGGRDLWN